MNKKIKYVAFYTNKYLKKENRIHILSATNKIDYICSALNRNGYDIEIISPSWTENTSGFFKGNIKPLSDRIKLKTFDSFGGQNKIQKVIKYLFSLIQLFFYLLVNTKKDEPIIVYHSVILFLPIKFAKFFRRFKLILEVEEIYQDVVEFSKRMKHNEYIFFKMADKYIFSTELLNEKLNLTNKPYTIIYGTYQVEEEQKFKFEDDKIHVIYAGTFDPRKGGALAAAAAAEYLPKNYHVHIIGFGSKEEINHIQDTIKEVLKKTEATITYNGLLKGEEYIRFLQKCDIGLSTQIPDAAYNETSFPSKILSYMANGLRVVTVRIKAIEMSAIGNAVYYYEEQTPESIAKAILSVNIEEPYDSRSLIKKLGVRFDMDIKKLLEN